MSPFGHGLIAPLLMAALVLWGVYRRARRAFGRQRVLEGRMWVRIAVLTIAGVLVLLVSAREAWSVAALLAGIACGAALGYVGLRHTRFEASAEGRFYTPHAYIGLAVTALFVGRLLYRFLALYSGAHGIGPIHAGLGAPHAGLGGFPAYAPPYAQPIPYSGAGPYASSAQYDYQNPYAYQRSPLTLAIFGALVGYYVLFYLGVLRKSRLAAASGETHRAP